MRYTKKDIPLDITTEGIIAGTTVTGVIIKDPEYDNRYAFLQDSKNGGTVRNAQKYGYKYSWIFYLRTDGILSDNVTLKINDPIITYDIY